MKRRDFLIGISAVGATALFAGGMMHRMGMGGMNGAMGRMNGGMRDKTASGDSDIETPSSFFNPLKIPQEIHGELRDGVVHYDMTIQEGVSEFIKNLKTPTWGINGAYLGATIRLKRGDEVSINWHNRLPEATTMHGHGMHLPAVMDGGVHQVIKPNSVWSAKYRVNQSASTNWYHPHMMNKTAKHVYRGLGGLIYIDDDTLSLGLPKSYGEDDIPLVIQDRIMTKEGKLYYPDNMMTRMHGFYGNILLINGTLAPYKEVKASLVRLRLLNASNARVYRLGFDSIDMNLIAGDNSFLEESVKVSSILLSPAERAEVVVDLRGMEGKNIVLSDKNSGAGIVELRVRGKSSNETILPEKLSELEEIDLSSVKRIRRFRLEMRGPGRLTINGKSMDPNIINERLKLGESEIWEIENRGMMGRMMGMNHNFHMHGGHFRVLERNGRVSSVKPWERGYKDTVFLAPGDRVRVLVKHTDYSDAKNPYMYHCHILEHEDAGMMGQFTVV